MRNLFKLLSVSFLIITVSACGMITGNKFVYIGHGEDSPYYQLYYDQTKKLFVLIDKRNGCFQKDDTGTCLAFTLQQARDFRKKALSKMIEIDLRLAKDNYGDYAIKELENAGISIIKKQIKIEDIYAKPIRQIVIDRKQKYHLVRRDYKVGAKLVAMVTKNDGKDKIKVAYTIDFPGLYKEFKTQLRPFIVDPEYLYTHMTIDSVHQAQFMQKDMLKSQKKVTKQVDKYLKDVVDASNEKVKDPNASIANKVSKLDSDLVTDNPMLEPSGSGAKISDNQVASGSAIDSAKSSTTDKVSTEDDIEKNHENTATTSK